MTIHVLHAPADEPVAEIVAAGLRRSFSAAQVARATYQAFSPAASPRAAVLIAPGEPQDELVARLVGGGRKVALFGRVAGRAAELVGVRCGPLPPEAAGWGEVELSETRPWDASPGRIRYDAAHPLNARAPYPERFFCRFDFTDEWNNLGYGRIPTGGGHWSLAARGELEGATALAEVWDGAQAAHGPYAAVNDGEQHAALWFNRPVGPVDSLEWCLVEDFFASHRAGELDCFPCLCEAPAGFGAGVTMRLDCDQRISTARPLFDLYREVGVPFSLAVLTGLEMTPADLALLDDVAAAGGTLASHSVSHLPNWGEDYEQAHREAVASRRWLEQRTGRAGMTHAVSPFHQNPPHAVKALWDAGYTGFIAGIIHNDPEYLLGRSGVVPFAPEGIVSQSQQCMVHGDCYHRAGNSQEVYRESFRAHLKGGAAFGYLDHPLSETYQYGWRDVEEQVGVHTEFLSFLRGHEGIWWCNLADCLDFVVKRANTRVWVEPDGRLGQAPPPQDHLPPVAIHWRGRNVVCG